MKPLRACAIMWGLTALCILATVGCATVEEPPPEPASKPIVMSATTLQKLYPKQPSYQDILYEKDITYATVDGVELKLNLARPATAEELLPGMIFIHGGWWDSFGRQDMNKYVRLAAIRGYAAVTIDHRMMPRHQFPGPVGDVSCAVRWLRAHAGEYGVDPSRIGIMGIDSGVVARTLVAEI